MSIQARDRVAMAARVAADIPEGWWVNLGIGIPVLVADHVPLDREVVFHSENGVLGMGPAPEPGKVNPWLINAGKTHVTLRPGGSFVPPRRQLRADPRRPSRPVRPRRVRGGRERRHRQLVALRQRLRAGGRRRDGSCGRRQTALGRHGTHDQVRRATPGERGAATR